jgi:4-amino-4-deoxy-L-arabinose transferase-like glycosyltransferase
VISVPGVPSVATVRVLRALQAVLSTATVYGVYSMTRLVSGQKQAGWVVSAILACSVAHIALRPAQIMTETLYLFLLSLGMAHDLHLTAAHKAKPSWHFALVGVWFGLATLTRAVVVLFPLGLALHALIVWRMGANQPRSRCGACSSCWWCTRWWHPRGRCTIVCAGRSG